MVLHQSVASKRGRSFLLLDGLNSPQREIAVKRCVWGVRLSLDALDAGNHTDEFNLQLMKALATVFRCRSAICFSTSRCRSRQRSIIFFKEFIGRKVRRIQNQGYENLIRRYRLRETRFVS